jgi:hypothetical protein
MERDGPSPAEIERRERARSIVDDVLATIRYTRQHSPALVWESYGIEKWVGATVCVLADPIYVTFLGNSPELHKVGTDLERRFTGIGKRVVIGYDS